MKRTPLKTLLLLGIIAWLGALSSCKKDNPEPDPAPTLTFASASLTCELGGSTCSNVASSSIPNGGPITYTISTSSVATVNPTTGVITPVAAGTATITATQAAAAGKNKQATATYDLTITGLSIISFTPTVGGVGYSVTITGTNFDGTTASNNIVKINDVQTATPTAISQTSLTVLVPKGATGVGNITVTVGTQTASKGSFTEYATVSTLAGDGTQGWKDDTGIKAQFFTPAGLVIDDNGNVLVADYANNRIRSITAAGVVTTIAGDGSFDYLDGTGTSAKLNQPWGIAFNSFSGKAYVTDRGDNHVRSVRLSDKQVATVAGSVYSGDGFADGTNLTNVQFDQPQGIACDPFNNLYMTDRWFSLVREINPINPGYVITRAGNNTSDYINGTGTNTAFYFPDGIVVDATGDNAYVADHTNNCIRKITLQGTTNVVTFAGAGTDQNGAGGSTDGTGTAARFAGPAGLAIDASGNLYVADYNNGLIRKITPAGVVTTIAGQINTPDGGYLDGLGPDAKIYSPLGIAVDSDGNIYVSDGTNRIRKIVP